MTLKQFETALRQCTDRIAWDITPTTALRGHMPAVPPEMRVTFCPITAVAYTMKGSLWSIEDAQYVAQVLGLSITESRRIQLASEGFVITRPLRKIRARLLACVGLPPEGSPDATR